MPRPSFISSFQMDFFYYSRIFENLNSAGSKNQEIKLFWPKEKIKKKNFWLLLEKYDILYEYENVTLVDYYEIASNIVFFKLLLENI